MGQDIERTRCGGHDCALFHEHRLAETEVLHAERREVMLEAAATSFQVHLQVPADEIVRTYDAALIASGRWSR